MRQSLLRLAGRLLGAIGLALAWLLAFGLVAWATGALYYDFPVSRSVMACVFLVAMIAAVVRVPGRVSKLLALAGGFTMVLLWWLTLKASNEADWLPDVAQLAFAKVDGDEVTLHNVRNCDYHTETNYKPWWETRTVRLSQITGIDMAINYWGSPWMAHPIVSFQFADAAPVCFSIETRKEIGESYSAIGGLYRQFELIYIVADERDVIRVRTNFRTGENVYLYRTTLTPSHARERFLEYIHSLNELHALPRWYNAITTNCTTSIRAQHPTGERIRWDWRILLNGKGDEMMYERGMLATGGLPFAELKERALINKRAKAAGGAAEFSQLIRAGMVPSRHSTR